MSKKLYEDIKNFLIKEQKEEGNSKNSYPFYNNKQSSLQNKPIKPKNNLDQGVQKLDNNNPIHHFASFISPNSKRPGLGLAMHQKPSKENMDYAESVHSAVNKFKNDDDAISHLHKLTNPTSELTDEKKNLYGQHINHMRNVIAGSKFRQLVK